MGETEFSRRIDQLSGSDFVGAEEGKQMLSGSGPQRDPEIRAMVIESRERAQSTLDRILKLRDLLSPVLHRDDETKMHQAESPPQSGPIETPLGEDLWQILGPLHDMNRILNDIEGRLEL